MKQNEIISPGHAIIISDGVLLEEAIRRVIEQYIAQWHDEMQRAADAEAAVEQHDAATAIGVDVRTLRRWCQAGAIREVACPGRKVYYRKSDIDRLTAGRKGNSSEGGAA